MIFNCRKGVVLYDVDLNWEGMLEIMNISQSAVVSSVALVNTDNRLSVVAQDSVKMVWHIVLLGYQFNEHELMVEVLRPTQLNPGMHVHNDKLLIKQSNIYFAH